MEMHEYIDALIVAAEIAETGSTLDAELIRAAVATAVLAAVKASTTGSTT